MTPGPTESSGCDPGEGLTCCPERTAGHVSGADAGEGGGSSLVERDFRRIACPISMTSEPESPPAEGVRILGAEEAQAAVEGGPERPRAEEPPRRRRRRTPPEDVQPAARFPLPADRLPGDDARPDAATRPAAAGGSRGR